MINRIKEILYIIIFYSGFVYVFRCFYRIIYRNPVNILYCHRIIDITDEAFPFLKMLGYCTYDEFENRIKYLFRHYKFISLQEANAYLKGAKKRRPNCIALTFDDGYKDNYSKIFPLLKQYNIPATIFLSTHCIDTREMLWHDKVIYLIAKTKVKQVCLAELKNTSYNLLTLADKAKFFRQVNKLLKDAEDAKRKQLLKKLFTLLGFQEGDILAKDLMLSWDEIKEMHNSGLVSFGSHTLTHPILTKLPEEEIRKEVFLSKLVINNNLPYSPVEFFSYPGGFWDTRVENIVKEAGYKAAFGTFRSVGRNHFNIERMGFTNIPIYMFGLMIAGFFNLVKPKNSLTTNNGKENIEPINTRGLRYWLPNYFLGNCCFKRNHKVKPKHIILCLVDHFEPFHGGANFPRADLRVKTWLTKYPQIGSYKDADGVSPQHTWFYPPHLDHCFLKDLAGLCIQGYGEIEMHLHHNHMAPFPDTSETLKLKILKCIQDYSKYGIFCLPNGSKRFGFIHGDWSLDNSRGEYFCGVNNEILILKECGCYADFTFPSLGKAQPAMINRIYYVKDNPVKEKSYNWGKEVIAGRAGSGDLLMIPGVIGLRWKSRKRQFQPAIESSNVDVNDTLTPQRVDYLVDHAIVIKDRPDWKFIKLHTHGAVESTWDVLFGKAAMDMYEYLLGKYNDGKEYVIHFVTAREMFNIVKAAEAGKTGNPGNYRNYAIPRYLYSV